jgi:glucosylglycerate synthase
LTVETYSVPQQVQEKTEPIESADLVVGVLAEFDSDAFAKMCDALHSLPGPLRIAVLEKDKRGSPASANSETAGKSSSAETAQKNPSVFCVPSLLTRPDSAATGAPSMFAAYQSVFAAAERLRARGCCIIASKPDAVTPQWARQLAQPLFEGQIDLVLPHYARRKYEGLLNNCIIAPLVRALYGKRVNNPMGPDLGVSQRLVQRVLGARGGGSASSNRHPLASLTPVALCENLQVIEVHFGARIYPPTDWTNMSSVLADVLTPVFLDMEQNAPCWQRMRASVAVSAIGEPLAVSEDKGAVDTSRMVETFQLGNRELQEVWGSVLPPSTLLELRKLSRLPPEQFRMPDELWVRIVYDFALAHRLRTISRDHLLRSMTPLYLAWVASYAHDLQTSAAVSPERRLERLSLAYEGDKPYLVSRWRWPDRFNP